MVGKQAHRAKKWPRVGDLPALAGVWLSADEEEISATCLGNYGYYYF